MVSKAMTPGERAKVFKALADPRRVEIVELLAQGSQCGTIIAESLGISVALLSHHWQVLVDAGLLKKERVGQLRYCSLDVERLREAMSMGAAWEKPQAPVIAKGSRAQKIATGKPRPRPTAKKQKSSAALKARTAL